VSLLIVHFNLFNNLPSSLEFILELFSEMNVIFAMILLGLNFTFSIKDKHILFSTISIRMLGGGLVAYLISMLFSLSNIERITIIIASSMPIGMTVLFYSLLYKKEQELAANLVSISLVIGFILIAILLNFQHVLQ